MRELFGALFAIILIGYVYYHHIRRVDEEEE